MLNLYEDIRTKKHYNKFELGDLIFAEYTCPIEQTKFGIWTHTDFLIHVVSGKKTWHTTNGSWTAEAGQTLFFKKGAAIVEQFFEEDFCLLLFFIPDDFVRSVLKEFAGTLKITDENADTLEPAIRVNNDTSLTAFFQSMMIYFSRIETPSNAMLKLKLQELVVGILESRSNPSLSSYFRSLGKNKEPVINQIMEANFLYNLSIEDYAVLCHRSLSSFKRDFQKQYGETPGRWLLKKRLDHAAMLLHTEEKNISQIVFECGFEDISHFSKAFKNKFGVSPAKFRSSSLLTT